MKVNIIMPKMGESLSEGTIIKWHKNVGDFVKKDEIIFEITTDKVDTEIPSPAEGILSDILVHEQETVNVDTVVAVIDTDLVTISENENPVEKEPAKNSELIDPIHNKSGNTFKESLDEFNNEENTKSNINGHDISTGSFLSPAVLNIAQKENVSSYELKNITGTGINGRITKKDILDYVILHKNKTDKNIIRERTNQVKTSEELSSLKQSGVESNIIIPMNNIRQQIMKHMLSSRDTSVHVAEVTEVDMTKIYSFIKNNKENFYRNENIKLTYMPFIALACIQALKENSLINSSIVDNNIVIKKNINLGIAVALVPDGLIVPNIKNVDEKSFKKIALEIAELSEKAKKKLLTYDDITGGTFTISNYGVFGTLFGTPIINQPEVAILGVGSVIKKPVVVEIDGEDAISIRPMMYLTLSHDHRLIDGMLGGKFLKSLKNSLESFETNLI